MTLRYAVSLALLALAGCGAPEISDPVPCQERILAVRQSASLDPAQSRTLSNAFRELSRRYAELDESDCSERQRIQLDQLERISADLSKLAADADQAKLGKAARDSRMPDQAVLTLANELQAYENRLSVLRRQLREMQRGQQ